MIIEKFNDFNLSTELLKAIDMLEFINPTDVQKQAIPLILSKKDIIIKSQTGSGKTAAFAIPMCELVDWDDFKPQVIVLTPTRELANQVREDIFNIGRFKRIKVVSVYGKSPIESQIKNLKQKTHFVVGTPGRVFDLIERGSLDVSNIKYFVLDEADEMMNMGFIKQIKSIVDTLPTNKITTLLSATISENVKSLSNKYMHNAIFLEISNENSVTSRIRQVYYNANSKDKMNFLLDITVVENPDSAIIFCNTRQTVDIVNNELEKQNYICKKIHGGMEQRDRTKVMNEFKEGYFRYLIATDVAARGIDVENITHIINYDIPQDINGYVHRIGRTGRKNNKGVAITFVTANEINFLDDIQNMLDKKIVLKKRPSGKIVDGYRNEFEIKLKSRKNIEKPKGIKFNEEIMKIHINAGKKTKMRPTDIVGAISNIEGIKAEDIGIISIIDVSTFVEILNNKGEYVFDKLQTTPIKGRLRIVSKANK
jgi:superfamily II DNA/RNA helicase